MSNDQAVRHSAIPDAQIPPRRLLQKITLMWMLNQIPGDPVEYDLSEKYFQRAARQGTKEAASVERTRRLHLNQEQEIADSIAFISATSDDPLNVMAVGLEEHVNGIGMTIRFASNVGEMHTFEHDFRSLIQRLVDVSRECPIP